MIEPRKVMYGARKKSVNRNHFGNNFLNSEHDEYKDHQQMKLHLLKPSICGYVANVFFSKFFGRF